MVDDFYNEGLLAVSCGYKEFILNFRRKLLQLWRLKNIDMDTTFLWYGVHYVSIYNVHRTLNLPVL